MILCRLLTDNKIKLYKLLMGSSCSCMNNQSKSNDIDSGRLVDLSKVR